MAVIIEICKIIAIICYLAFTVFMLIQGIRGVTKRRMIFIGWTKFLFNYGYYEGKKAIILGIISLIFGIFGLSVGYFIFFLKH